MKRINYAVLALIFANVIWGATSPIIKFALENIPPFSLAFIRFLLASLLLYPFVHKRIDYPDLKNKWLWIFAFSGITFNIIFFFLALQRTASINAPIIGSSGPIMVLVGSVIFLREKVKMRSIIGMTISFVGVLWIIFMPILTHGFDGEVVGNLFLIMATLGAVVSTVAGRKFLTPGNAWGMTFWACLIGTLTFFPLMLWEYSVNPGWFATLDYRGWTGILYGAVFSSALAYGASSWALSKLTAFRTSIFSYLDPVVAIAVAIPLLGEKITPPFFIGSVLVFAGIYIAENRLNWHPLRKLFESGKIEMS